MFKAIATALTDHFGRKTSTVDSAEPSSWPTLFQETRDMVEVATLIYHFANLRKKHREGDIKLDDDRMVAEAITESIEAGDLYAFFSENEATLRENLGDDSFVVVNNILRRQTEQATQESREQKVVPPPQLVVFDDENDRREFVYAINVNHTQKRVVVVFRGSVTLTDFIVDARIRQTYVENPVKGKKQKSLIGLHTGFKEYLFGKQGKPSAKFNKLMDEVKDLLQKHDDYKLYVTGHSLGAALCTLFALHIAAESSEMGIREPVTCIPIASPKVGDYAFQTAFRALEERGLIRLVRVENRLDLVTLVPNPYTFRFWAIFNPSRMYRHVGCSVTLYKRRNLTLSGTYVFRKLEVVRNIFSHLLMLGFKVPSLVIRNTDFFANHSCNEYLQRLYHQEDKLESLSLNAVLIRFNPTIRRTGALAE